MSSAKKVAPKAAPPVSQVALVTAPHLKELEEIARKIASGSATIGDETRAYEIGVALSRGLPVPPKVVGKIANHRAGRGIIRHV